MPPRALIAKEASSFHLAIREKWIAPARARSSRRSIEGVRCPRVFAVFPRGAFCASNFYRRLLLVHRNLHLPAHRRRGAPRVRRGAPRRGWGAKKRRKEKERERERERERARGHEARGRDGRGKKDRRGREKKGARQVCANACATA